MTDEQINAAIAEACGFIKKDEFEVCENGTKFIFWEYPESWNGPDLRPWVPPFCTDLNAIHEAEQEQWRKNHTSRYVFLSNIVMPPTGYRAEAADLLDAILDATARQRAEAFLKTIGKWKEAE
jgi:hypothetical protein